MQGLGGQVSVAYKDLCLFPDVQLPAGFKMPKFDLYDGHGDPVDHLRGFCSKMRGAGGKDELLMAYFSQRLSGSALEWYTRQDHGRWYTWDDLAQAFACHFQYNLEIVPDRLSLIKLEKKPGESFREYGFRWREQAARVDPPMKESEMVDYFLQALEPTYFGHLVNAIGKSFNEVVKMGGMVEEGLKSNKIMSYSAIKATTQAIQSGTGGVLGKNKKEEVATVESGAWSRSRGPSPYYNQPRPHHQNYPYTPYIPPQHYYPPPDPHFSVHHAQTYTQPPAHAQWRAPALQNSYPAPKNTYPPPRAYRNPPEQKFGPLSKYCSGALGHDTEKCWKLKTAVQELIDTHRIEVQAPDAPNINQNPSPAHHEAHMIELIHKGGEPKKPSQMVMMIRASETSSKEKLTSGKAVVQLKGVDSKPTVVAEKGSSSIVAVKPEQAKVVIQGVANKPVVVMKGTRIELVIIKPVTQLPVTNSKAIPWSYEQVVVTYKGKEIKEEVCEAQGLTRSGRCFALEELRKARVPKDNPVLVKKAVTEEEAEKFLKKMKVQDYCIVEQLRKTPAQISLLSLLIHSDEHRRALMKILNEAHVPDKISVNHLEKIANKIFEVNRVTFSDDELPVEGTKHNMALYLTVKCEDSVVTRVLVDNGSSANICPSSTLNKLKVDDERIHKNNICVRGFDDGGKDSVGDIILELTIGPVEFTMEFQVLDEAVSYNLLLGRPWIHAAKAVPSTLHQMVKFEWDRQEIVVHGEDNMCALSDAIVPFIEVDDDKGPWVYEVFDTVSVEKVLEGKSIPVPRITAATVMVASEMLKNGFIPGKGLGADLQGIVHPVSLPKNLDTFGLGFKPTAADVRRARKMKKRAWVLPKPIPRLSRSFIRPGIRKQLLSKVSGSLIGADGDLDKGFERLFAEVNMVEAGEGSSKANVQVCNSDIMFCPIGCVKALVPSGKLLGFIVSRWGIELDPSKIKAIRELPPPRNKTEKDAAVKWTDECQEAFDKIKGYLSNPPVLVPPEPGRPLILYLTVLDNSFGC
ncbi:PREDICTED: uncharacterized protein LOC109222047, partial [Nicotiana attenuata]|uniref:uncharacterized protein LOC109222047 n=1 Tax=Nicotiana attenuata TaxID=49451 RepID=UPI00090472ED